MRLERSTVSLPGPLKPPRRQGTGWSFYRVTPPNGEDMANLFEAWRKIATLLDIMRGTAKYKAVAKYVDSPRDPLLYTLGPNPRQCATEVVEFYR